MRRHLPFLLALCALFPAQPTRAAAMLGVTTPQVRAGAMVTLQWSGLAPGTQEVELELSLEGGRWVRISPELEAIEGEFRWHVPARYSGSARLRLRAGRAHEEGIVAETSLTIAPSSDLDPARIDARSEWWNLAEHPHEAPTSAFSGGEATWAPLTSAPAVAPATGDGAIVTPPTASLLPTLPSDAGTQPPPARAFLAPRRSPLRN